RLTDRSRQPTDAQDALRGDATNSGQRIVGGMDELDWVLDVQRRPEVYRNHFLYWRPADDIAPDFYRRFCLIRPYPYKTFPQRVRQQRLQSQSCGAHSCL